MPRAMLLITLLGIATLLFAGCSETSQGSITTTGRALLTIHWPDRARMIPVAANTIQITITQPGTSFSITQVIDRPSTDTTSPVIFDNLPLGNLLATASAFASNNTHATPLATGTAPLTIRAGTQTTFAIRLGSTITSLQVTPPTSTLQVGQSSSLGVVAYAGTDVVLVTNASLQWKAVIAPGTTAAGAVVTVDTTGVITALLPGTAQITVKDSESGVSATAFVTVQNPLNNTVSSLLLTGVPQTLHVGQSTALAD